MDNWIAAQQEQVTAIKTCMASVNQTTCMQSALSQSSGRWANAQSQLMNAYQALTNDLKMGAVRASPSS